MPEGIDNEKLWEKAKELYKKNYKREPDNERDFSYVMDIYLKLGGKTSKEFIQMAEKLIKGERMNLTEKINKLKQKVFLKESHMQVGDVSELNGVKVKVTKVLDNGYEVEEIIEESFKELSSNVSYWISDEYEFKGKKGESLINAVKQKFNVDRGTAISMINQTMKENGFNYKIKESYKERSIEEDIGQEVDELIQDGKKDAEIIAEIQRQEPGYPVAKIKKHIAYGRSMYESLNKKEAAIVGVFEDAKKMFYQGFEIGAVKARLKDKYPSISAVNINDSVDRAFSDVGSNEESFKKLKEKFFKEAFKEFNKFDDVRIKSKNLAGMIYEISGNDVVVKTIKGLVKTTKDDLEMMPQESTKEKLNRLKETFNIEKPYVAVPFDNEESAAEMYDLLNSKGYDVERKKQYIYINNTTNEEIENIFKLIKKEKLNKLKEYVYNNKFFSNNLEVDWVDKESGTADLILHWPDGNGKVGFTINKNNNNIKDINIIKLPDEFQGVSHGKAMMDINQEIKYYIGPEIKRKLF